MVSSSVDVFGRPLRALSATDPVSRNLLIHSATPLWEMGSLSKCNALNSAASTRELRFPHMRTISTRSSVVSTILQSLIPARIRQAIIRERCAIKQNSLRHWTPDKKPHRKDVSHAYLSIKKIQVDFKMADTKMAAEVGTYVLESALPPIYHIWSLWTSNPLPVLIADCHLTFGSPCTMIMQVLF